MKFISFIFGVTVLISGIAYATDDMAEIKAKIGQILREQEDEIYNEVTKEVGRMDKNHDDYVSMEEFIGFESHGTVEQKKQAFKAMDSNSDGYLTQGEIWLYMKSKIDAF